MRHNFIAPVFLLLLAAGCASAPTPRRIDVMLPGRLPAPDALITQRAILTAHGRQFALNGYVARSAAGGLRLKIADSFGPALADVLIQSDGKVLVMHSSHMFKAAWIRRYVAADLAAVFGGQLFEAAVTEVDPGHFVIKRRWYYTLDLKTVDTKPGPQPAALFDPAGAEKP